MADAHTFEFRPGRLGQAQGPAGVTLTELTDFGLASVLARKGRAADVARLVLSAHGVELPATPRMVEAGDASFVWSGPGHWLVLSAQAADLESRIHRHLGDTASVFDQSDSRILLELAGPRARDVLAKGVSIDLDPARLPARRCRDHHRLAPGPAALAGVRCARLPAADHAHLLRQLLALVRCLGGGVWLRGAAVANPRGRTGLNAGGLQPRVVVGPQCTPERTARDRPGHHRALRIRAARA